MVLDVDGTLCQVIEYQHVNPGKGAAFVRSKLRVILTGKVLDKTWRAGEKVTEVRVEHRVWEYLYRDESTFVVMDPETYEQVHLDQDLVGDAAFYLKENCSLKISFVDGSPILIEPPDTIELLIVKTDPGLRGDTASGGSKPATLETGLVVQVPLFIQEGETIRVDTRTNQYLERVTS